MSELGLVSVFVQQLRRHIGSDIVAEWYEEFFATRGAPVRLAGDASRSSELLEVCANLFFLSQEITNAVVHGKSSHVAVDVANSVSMFSAIDAILHENFSGKQLEGLSTLFNDALFRLSVPPETENALLSRAMLEFLAKIHVPRCIALILDGRECCQIENEELIAALFAKKYAESGDCDEAALSEALGVLGVDIGAACSFRDTLAGPVKRLLDAALEK